MSCILIVSSLVLPAHIAEHQRNHSVHRVSYNVIQGFVWRNLPLGVDVLFVNPMNVLLHVDPVPVDEPRVIGILETQFAGE